jgi:glycine/D-amino acid oxidase-like deaminating enzyme
MRTSEFDLVVVGAGALGLCTALAAVESRPDWSILVVDRDLPGGGATRWSAGMAVPFGPTPGHPALIRRATTVLRNWFGLVQAESGRVIEKMSSFVVGSDETVHRLGDRALPGSLAEVDVSELQQVCPDIRVYPGEVVLRCVGTYRIHAEPFISAIWRCLVAQPAVRTWIGTEVVSVRRVRDGYELLTAAGVVTTAARVVLALGAWFADPAAPLGAVSPELDIRAKRVVGLHCSVPAPAGSPMVEFVDDDLFITPDPANQSVFVSFYRDEWLSPGDGPAPVVPSQKDIDLGRESLERRSRGLAERVVGGRVAYDGYAPNRVPIVRRDEGGSLVVVAGGSGSGLRLAPALATEAVRLLTDAEVAT